MISTAAIQQFARRLSANPASAVVVRSQIEAQAQTLAAARAALLENELSSIGTSIDVGMIIALVAAMRGAVEPTAEGMSRRGQWCAVV